MSMFIEQPAKQANFQGVPGVHTGASPMLVVMLIFFAVMATIFVHRLWIARAQRNAKYDEMFKEWEKSEKQEFEEWKKTRGVTSATSTAPQPPLPPPPVPPMQKQGPDAVAVVAAPVLGAAMAVTGAAPAQDIVQAAQPSPPSAIVDGFDIRQDDAALEAAIADSAPPAPRCEAGPMDDLIDDMVAQQYRNEQACQPV